jgi:septum site-determining protein MinD
MRIISVVSGKGGVGKTTMTANLGVVLSRIFNKNTIAIDCNVTTPHLGMFLGIENSPITFNHVLKGEANVNEAMYNHSGGMWVIPSSLPLSDMEGVDISLIEESVKKVYDKYIGKVDIVLLDCAPGLGRDALAGIKASDEMLFVSTPTMPSLMDVVRCNSIVRDMGIRHIGVALNMIGRGSKEVSKDEVERITGLPVLAEIPEDSNILKSLSMSIPVTVSHPKSRSSRQIVKLAHSLLQQHTIHPSYSMDWRGR